MCFSNPQDRVAWQKRYNESDKGKKCKKLSRWRSWGLIGDIEEIYKIYIETTHCMKCSIELTDGKPIKSTTKCMDHDHISKEYRAILCHTCNRMNPLDIHPQTNNKSTGIKNIYIYPNGFRFEKQIKGKKHSKCFATIEEAIEYKSNLIS
tara:strand:+ start:34 stop:483 length:450 start_codon:yes stop_codon:yes gene_type:complete